MKKRGQPLTRDELIEALQNPESPEAKELLFSISRFASTLKGTRPYWFQRRKELDAYAYNLDCSGGFATFSPADYHWRSLYCHMPQFEEWQTASEPQWLALSRRLLRDNPHIAAWHFYRRFTLFRDIVLKKKFNVNDYWVRYEWQGRGSPHCHGLYWMEGTPVIDMEDEQVSSKAVSTSVANTEARLV